jgi:hypothetical protein
MEVTWRGYSGRPEPSADLLRQLDDDPLGAADVAEPIHVFVAAEQEGIVNVYSVDSPSHPYLEAAKATLSAEELAEADVVGRQLSATEALALGGR